MARTLQYWEAAYPDPFTILGLRLKPFSLGHYFILRRLDCAFVADEERQATVADLITGVLVCSMNPDEFIEFMQLERGGPAKAFHKAIQFRFRDAWKILFQKSCWQEIARWSRKLGQQEFVEKAKLFQEYLSSQTDQPAYWLEGETAEQAGGHWSHSLLHVLLSQCGYTFEQAWTAPISRCLQDYFKQAEASGQVRLLTPEELKELEVANVAAA